MYNLLPIPPHIRAVTSCEAMPPTRSNMEEAKNDNYLCRKKILSFQKFCSVPTCRCNTTYLASKDILSELPF